MTRQDAEKLYNYINDFGTLKAHVKDRTDSTVTVDWDLYKDADGYIVYGNKCNHDGKKYKVKKLATIKDPTKTEYTVTGLESGTYYKFTIKAYKVVDGKKYVTVKSYYVHGSTSGGKQRVTSEIEIDSTGMKKANSVTLKKGKSYSVNAKRYNEKNKKVSHSDIRYESTDTAVATVSKKGKITATGKGKCTILVIAENGLYEEIKVKVK